MTQYFQLRDDVTVHGRWHVAELLLPSGEEPLLDTGVPLRNPGPLAGTVSRPGRVLDFSLTSFSVPVATKRLADASSRWRTATFSVFRSRLLVSQAWLR
jgi:hypothetical protein